MVRHRVFAALLVFYLQVEFLKEQHPSYESWFGLFLGEQLFQGRMISVDDDLAPQDVRPELLESVDHRQKLFLRRRVINLSFNEGLTCVADGRRLLVQSLPQDRSHRVVQSVAHNLEG